MFTGLIEEKGKVVELSSANEAMELKIEAPSITKSAKLGDSIAINGVCLTVKELQPPYFFVDLMPETVRATSLRIIDQGSQVNLEPSLGADGRFGGHMVSGHVDGVGTIIDKKPVDNAVYFRIQIDKELASQLIHKGSIAVDGISLTVFEVGENDCLLSIIPHTLEHTTLGEKALKDPVNIELDMVGKYIKKHLNQYFSEQNGKSIDMELLKRTGFVTGDDTHV